MRVVRTIAALRGGLTAWRKAGERIGLVPTMGALHAGHMALVEASRSQCQRVVATIFVNPKQFAPGEDLGTYPRPEAADLDMFQSAGVDIAFLPTVEEMYPSQFTTVVQVGGLSEGLCGAHRAGHFDGVATVVTKLLMQTLPDTAYFGEKDYQQLLVIRRMVRDLDIPVTIEGVPIVREPDGLAMSSRNRYLSAAERRTAPQLARVLRGAAVALERAPDTVARETDNARAELTRAAFNVEYLEVRSTADLAPMRDVVTEPARVLAAVHLGRTRLIDNFPIGLPAQS
ncbi:MAG: pantoate--beta-alanine ligase [Stellaceae bacterium]